MKLTRDMAIFDDNLRNGVKLVGYALGFTLTIAMQIGCVISAFIFSTPHYSLGSRHRRTCLEPKQLIHRK
jgi:hypothetical protein